MEQFNTSRMNVINQKLVMTGRDLALINMTQKQTSQISMTILYTDSSCVHKILSRHKEPDGHRQ